MISIIAGQVVDFLDHLGKQIGEAPCLARYGGWGTMLESPGR